MIQKLNSPRPLFAYPRSRGFTLVELLVVITIIAALSGLTAVGTAKFIERGREVAAIAQFKDLEAGVRAYEIDYGRPPMTLATKQAGQDIVYGVTASPASAASNGFIIATLAGENQATTGDGVTETDWQDANPNESEYVTFPIEGGNKNGLGNDGILYDPWGNPVMIAINGLKATASPVALQEDNGGVNDKVMFTFGYAEYTNFKPRDESAVFWSYGPDGLKGDGEAVATTVIPLGSSDDLVSWR